MDVCVCHNCEFEAWYFENWLADWARLWRFIGEAHINDTGSFFYYL